jgi:uncharacterized membrane protein YhaH (DUF805 family)
MSLRTWFSLKGRISRLTWWIFYFLIPNGIIFGAGFLDEYLFQKGLMFKMFGGYIDELSIVSFLVVLLALWLGFVGQVKRWHDLSINGWWAFLTMIPTFAGVWFFLAFQFIMKDYFLAISVFPAALFFTSSTHVSTFFGEVVVTSIAYASGLLYIFWGLYFLIGGGLCGTPGPNRFGPDPLAPPDTTNIALPPQPQ